MVILQPCYCSVSVRWLYRHVWVSSNSFLHFRLSCGTSHLKGHNSFLCTCLTDYAVFLAVCLLSSFWEFAFMLFLCFYSVSPDCWWLWQAHVNLPLNIIYRFLVSKSCHLSIFWTVLWRISGGIISSILLPGCLRSEFDLYALHWDSVFSL